MTSAEPPVLIVEDDRLVRQYLEVALTHAGYVTVAAADGAAALDAAAVTSLTAVLIDGMLPDMHGIELAVLLLASGDSSLPICLVSGALSADIGARAGIAALSKPVRPLALAGTLSDLAAWQRSGGTDLPQRRAVLEDLRAMFAVRP